MTDTTAPTEPTDSASTLEKEEEPVENVLTRRRKSTTLATELATSPKALATARDTINRIVGVTVDVSLLDEDEPEKLSTLTRKLTDDADGLTDGGGWNWNRLTKRERKTWEKLVGKAAGDTDLFERERTIEQIRAKGRQAVAEAMKPPPRPVVEAAGALYLPSELLDLLGAQQRLRDRVVFQIVDLGLATYLLWLIENPAKAAPLLPPQGTLREEDGEVVLSISPAYGAIAPALDMDARLNWKKSLARLELAKFVTVDRSGGAWDVRVGEVGRFVTERSASAKRKAVGA